MIKGLRTPSEYGGWFTRTYPLRRTRDGVEMYKRYLERHGFHLDSTGSLYLNEAHDLAVPMWFIENLSGDIWVQNKTTDYRPPQAPPWQTHTNDPHEIPDVSVGSSTYFISKAEAMMAGKFCVLKVRFNNGGEHYSYLAPAEFDVDATPFVVVSTIAEPDVKNYGSTSFTIGKVMSKIDVTDDEYDGDYKTIVVGFSAQAYADSVARANKKKKLHAKLKQMSEEVNTVSQFEKLLAGNKEAEELLKQYKDL